MKRGPENSPAQRDSDFKRIAQKNNSFKSDLEQTSAWKKEFESKPIEYYRKYLEEFKDFKIPEKFLDDFFKYAVVCKTRNRITENYSPEPGHQKCHVDALRTAERTGYRLYSGFVHLPDTRTIWHCFNVDSQGYVFDSYPHGNDINLRGVYFGVEHSTYLQQALEEQITKGTIEIVHPYLDSVLDDDNSQKKFDALRKEYADVISEHGLEMGPLLHLARCAYRLPNLEYDKNMIIDVYKKNDRWYEMMSRFGLLFSKV